MLKELFDIILAITGGSPVEVAILAVLVVVTYRQWKAISTLGDTLARWDTNFEVHKTETTLNIKDLDEMARGHDNKIREHGEKLARHEAILTVHKRECDHDTT